MKMDEIRDHWDSLAKKHGLDLKSTTKTPTIKRLETLYRREIFLKLVAETVIIFLLSHNFSLVTPFMVLTTAKR